MGFHRSTVYIDAPPEAVWKVLTDANRRPEWEDAITSVREVSGPMDEVGASWVEVRLAKNREQPSRIEVTKVEAPQLIEWTGPLPAGAKLLFRVTLEPKNGGTQKSAEARTVLPLGPVGKALDKLFVERAWKRYAEQHGERSDAKLKELVESEQAQAGST